MIETINKLIRTSRALVQELGRKPTSEEIAKRKDIPVSKVRKVLKIAQEPISLETPIGEEEDSHLGDFIEDRNVVSRRCPRAAGNSWFRADGVTFKIHGFAPASTGDAPVATPATALAVWMGGRSDGRGTVPSDSGGLNSVGCQTEADWYSS